MQDGRRRRLAAVALPPADNMVSLDVGRTSSGPKQTLACSSGDEVLKVDKNCGDPGRVSQLLTVRRTRKPAGPQSQTPPWL